MHARYLRLDLHVSASDSDVIRAARATIVSAHRRGRTYRNARHSYYREMLKHHQAEQVLFALVVTGGI